MPTTLKALHDRLLAEKPADAMHEPCRLCSQIDDDGGPADATEGGSMSKTYTEEEMQAEVAKATAELDTRVKDLEASQQVSEVESKINAARAEKDAEIVELQMQLDAATLSAQTEKERADTIVAWLDEEKVAAEQAAVVSARRDERLAKVKEVASFPEGYLTKHADRFAAMGDEDFEAHLEGLREIASATKPTGDTVPAKTGLHASRDDSGRTTSSAGRDLISMRRTAGRVNLSNL